MVDVKMWMVPIAALIPLVIGFIWYNPKVFGTAWMNAAGLTEEKIKETNMALVFGLAYVFSCFIGVVLLGLTIHQLGLESLVMGTDENTISMAQQILDAVGDNFRTFKHGALHGTVAGIFFAFPLLATNALFDRRSWKYIFINSSYWTVSLGLMGGIICQFA